MNKRELFETFLESLKGNGHDNVINVMEQGFNTCFESTDDKRYVVQMEFYVHADSDESAVNYAHTIAKERRDQYDDQSKVTSVTPAPFGSLMGGKEIYKT